LGKTSEALSLLQAARTKFEAGFPLEFLTGLAFSRQQGFTEAMRHFVAAEVIARSTDPSRLNEFFFFQLGATCERKGDFEQAEKYLKLALEKAPGFAEAQNYLGYMWADRGQNLEEALGLIQKAVNAEPDNAAFLDSLGWVLFKKGQAQEALQHITQAIKLSEEEDATLYDHLGDIEAALGDRAKAVEAWEKSVTIEPDEKVRNKITGSTK
jgi:tetratricopeptide (TPR) repeat protein